MHVLSAVVWLGGLIFQGAVAGPIISQKGDHAKAAMRDVGRRFIGFIWMSVWTLLVTGVIMMLLDPRFVWFRYRDRWSILLGFKQLVFILMVLYAYGYARMMSYLDQPSSNGGFNERAELFRHRVEQFRKISIFLGLLAVLLAAAMREYV